METLMFRSNFHKYSKIFRALCARVILAGHGLLAIWVTGYINKDYMYIMYAVSIPLFLIETGLIIHFRLGCEFKRFCTSFFCYLLTIVPALWIQREYLFDSLNDETKMSNNTPMSLTNDTATNNKLDLGSALAATIGGNSSKILDTLKELSVTSLLEQSMMFIIILCRWLLPRGRIDRNSISQLLIMYSAISADILDFSELFDENALNDSEFRYIILGVWSWSLVQFTLVVTTSFTLPRQQRQLRELANPNSDGEDISEAVSILMVFFMQDGPFLVARCYALFKKNGVNSYNIIFFSLKNLLTLILSLYRLFVLCGCVSKDGNDLMTAEEVARSKESLDLIGMNTSKTTNKKNREMARSKESLDVISEVVTNKKKNTKQRNKR